MGDNEKYLENEEKCFICGKQSTQWKPIGPNAKEVPLCKGHYSNPKITNVASINRRLWYHRTKGGVKGRKCYLCGESVIAFIDIALDEAYVKDFPAKAFPEEWVQNIKQVCPDHVTPESRYEFHTNFKD